MTQTATAPKFKNGFHFSREAGTLLFFQTPPPQAPLYPASTPLKVTSPPSGASSNTSWLAEDIPSSPPPPPPPPFTTRRASPRSSRSMSLPLHEPAFLPVPCFFLALVFRIFSSFRLFSRLGASASASPLLAWNFSISLVPDREIHNLLKSTSLA